MQHNENLINKTLQHFKQAIEEIIGDRKLPEDFYSKKHCWYITDFLPNPENLINRNNLTRRFRINYVNKIDDPESYKIIRNEYGKCQNIMLTHAGALAYLEKQGIKNGNRHIVAEILQVLKKHTNS